MDQNLYVVNRELFFNASFVPVFFPLLSLSFVIFVWVFPKFIMTGVCVNKVSDFIETSYTLSFFLHLPSLSPSILPSVPPLLSNFSNSQNVF